MKTKSQMQRTIKRLEKSLKLSITIIRNCALGLEITGPIQGANKLWRFANELETESGLRKRKKPTKEP